MKKTFLLATIFLLLSLGAHAVYFAPGGQGIDMRGNASMVNWTNRCGTSGTFVTGILQNGSWNCSTPAGSGTITSVTAGNGLTGGGSSGGVTLAVRGDTCAGSNNVSVYNGTGFNCSGVSSTSGTGGITDIQAADNSLILVNASSLRVNTTLLNNTYVAQTNFSNAISSLVNLTPAQLGIGVGGNNFTIAQLGISGTNNLTLAQMDIRNESTAAGFGMVLEGSKVGIDNTSLMSTAFLQNATIVRAANCTAVDNSTHITVVQNISNSGSGCVLVAKNPGAAGSGGSGMTSFSINLSNNTAQSVINNSQVYFINTSCITLTYNLGNFTWGTDPSCMGFVNLTAAQTFPYFSFKNNSNQVWLTSNTTNVSIGNTSGFAATLFVDNTNARVGIDTAVPGAALDVVGTLNATTIQTSGTTRLSSTGVGTFATGTTVNSKAICLGDGTNCPGVQNGTVTSVATSGHISGGPITTTGTISMNTSGATAGPYGNATHVATLGIDANGVVYSATNTSISLPAYAVTGTLAVANGGTGQTTRIPCFDDGQNCNNMSINSSPVNGRATGIMITLTAGENISQWQAGYLNGTSFVRLGNAAAIATSSALFLATQSVTNGTNGTFLVLGTARNQNWTFTPGGLIYLSKTAGNLTQTQPASTDNVIQVMGIALYNDTILWKPELVQVELT